MSHRFRLPHTTFAPARAPPATTPADPHQIGHLNQRIAELEAAMRAAPPAKPARRSLAAEFDEVAASARGKAMRAAVQESGDEDACILPCCCCARGFLRRGYEKTQSGCCCLIENTLVAAFYVSCCALVFFVFVYLR